MLEQNEVNIPAFQRKRSLMAKAKKLSKTPKTRIKREHISILPQVSDIPREPTIDTEDFAKDRTKLYKSDLTEMQICGSCDGYFEMINVAVVKVTSPIRLDDEIIFETTNGLFQQKLVSMQQNRKDIELARTGSEIGIKVALPPKVGGNVYKII
ncbi:MAG: hypothetical protein RBS56_02490 [Candidatus Gracilibacteria bacterium]|jgi:hypothetical protein|nr:hypothetical protein [Candidatus Gracilibacteria bacterium]